MEKDPLIPAKAGTQADLEATSGRVGPRLRGDERWLGALAALFATPALAHEGHHETLTVAEQARHLLTQPDHVLAFAGLVVLAVIGRWQWRRAKARK
jgi:hypothetical protein